MSWQKPSLIITWIIYFLILMYDISHVLSDVLFQSTWLYMNLDNYHLDIMTRLMFVIVSTKWKNSSYGHKILRTCTVHHNSKYNCKCGQYNASQIIVTKTCWSEIPKLLLTKLFCNSYALMSLFVLFSCNLILNNTIVFYSIHFFFLSIFLPKVNHPNAI